MNNTQFIIMLAVVIIAIVLSSLIGWNCSKPDYTNLKRDSIIEAKIDSVFNRLDSIDDALDMNNLLIGTNEKEIKNYYTVYNEKKNEILNSPVDTALRHRLRDYYYKSSGEVALPR